MDFAMSIKRVAIVKMVSFALNISLPNRRVVCKGLVCSYREWLMSLMLAVSSCCPSCMRQCATRRLHDVAARIRRAISSIDSAV
eukprot:4076360-Amphidinium_carterae.3